MKRCYLIFTVCCFVALSSLQVAHAQTITEIIPFNFGTIALTDNASPKYITVARNGTVIIDPAILLVGPSPVPAEYSLTGFPPSTALTVSITDATLTSGLSPETFSLSQYEYTANPGTDGAGNYTLDIGYRLATNGSGSMYTDATYSGTLLITVAY